MYPYIGKEEKMTNSFDKYKKDINLSVESLKKKIQTDLKRKQTDFDSYPYALIKKELENVLPKNAGDLVELRYPPPNVEADLAFPIFDIAKKLSRNPRELAEEICQKINEKKEGFIESASTIGPFMNLILAKPVFYETVLAGLKSLDDKYGRSNLGEGKVAIIDYSSPNIAKPIGVHHLRSTIIGESLGRIYEANGYTVVRDNHLGDWGTQFGALALSYEMWGDGKKLEADPISELNNLYVKFHKESEINAELKEKARAYFKKMEDGDSKLLSLWVRFHNISLQSFKETYKKLNIRFDTYIGEAYFIDKTSQIVKECIDKKLAKKDPATGAVVGEAADLPTFLLQKKDGSSLYITRDLATLAFRTQEFKPDSILYVVGNEQGLSFKQLFAFTEKLNYLKNTDVKHISFGLVLSGGKKMSTRKGTLVKLDELIDESIKKSKEMLKEKNPELSEKELKEISEIIGMGAVFYNDLKQSRTKDISFDWKRMLDFHEGSAVYLQYTCVRVNSILKKLGEELNIEAKKFIFEEKSEFALAKKLMFYPLVIKEAREKDSPHIIATYLEELAQGFNSFYMNVSIMKTKDANLKASRVLLAKGVLNVIKSGLNLLNIKTPEKM